VAGGPEAKADRLTAEARESLSGAFDGIPLSALDAPSTQPLLETINATLWLEP
jgi:hypothetical protein